MISPKLAAMTKACSWSTDKPERFSRESAILVKSFVLKSNAFRGVRNQLDPVS